MATTRIRLIAALLSCVGILAVAFFLGVAPQLQARNTASTEKVAVDTLNDQHRARLDVLRAQFARIDQTRATLATLRGSVPETPATADFLDQVSASAATHSVAITNYTAQEPTPPIADVPVAPVPDPATTDTTTTNQADPGTTAAAVDPAVTTAAAPLVATGALTAGNFYAVPVRLTLTGDGGGIRNVISDLQTSGRLFLVTTSSVGPGSGPGLFIAELSGFIYIVTSATPAGVVDVGAATTVNQ
ncbi:MAG: hypothetical protein JWQ43_856 [Glaciihabitans sp.]|nr:hypothetical protein [Glaciihabitans sp.]